MLNKEELVRMLVESANGCEVKFRKIDGSERIMWCTLNDSLIPKQDEKPKSDKPKKKQGMSESKDHVIVWDLEKGAWRSFRCDSILRFSRDRSVVQK